MISPSTQAFTLSPSGVSCPLLRQTFVAAAAALIVASVATAEDWPQWRGPQRNAVSREIGLRQEWLSAAPQLAWRAEGFGEGYSSVVVSQGRIYTLGRRGQQVVCFCIDEQTGTLRWSRVIDETSRMPCSTPTVDGAHIYALDPDGDLSCLTVSNGDLVWRRSYLRDFGGVMMSGRGYGESPLVDGDHLICTPGGAAQTMVALDKRTGDLVWAASVPDLGPAGRPGAGFSSPVLSSAAGIRQYVQLIGRGVVGIRASDGKYLWGYNEIANQTANIPTPIVAGDLVFAANGYNAGSVLLKLTPQQGGVAAQEVYTLGGGRFQNHHGGVVLQDGHLYGGHGSNNGLPTCLNLATGKQQWKRRGPGVGSAAVVMADGRLYFRYQNGVVALISVTPDNYELQGTFSLPGAGGDSWSHPVIANGRLLLREKDRIFAYDIREPTSQSPGAERPVGGELALAIQADYQGRSLFRYARHGEQEITLERMAHDDIRTDGTLRAQVLARFDQHRGDLVIDLAGLPISDAGVAQLARIPRLRGISLELCEHVTDDGLRELSAATDLRVLRLTGTAITGEGLRPLVAMPNLTALDLEVCEHIADAGCRELAQMHQLKALVLKKTGFEQLKITPDGLMALRRLTALESLSLYGNRVDNESLAKLAELTKLRELDLSLTAVTDDGLAQLATLGRLEHLDLLYSEGFAGPKITDVGIQRLSQLANLRSLNVVGAKISDTGLQQLGLLAQLRAVHIANTRVSDAAVAQLQVRLPRCRIIR